MAYAIALFVALGLVAYLAASLVGVGNEPRRDGLGSASAFVRRFLDGAYGISPMLLALIWIGYGLLHLLMPCSAYEQIPDGWFDDIRPAVWGASGALEIAMGLLVVNQRWRRWALLAQLLMLVALVPFVAYMLGDDDAVTDVLRGMNAPEARVVLVLHNLLLFAWVARLYRDEVARVRSSGLVESAPLARRSGGWRAKPIAVVAFVLLAANLAGCCVIALGPWRSGALYLWAMGSLATGALVGFLFGVPRWVAPTEDGKPRGTYQPNTNIEVLSDWLTKMLVGVGLVQLHQLGPTLSRVAAVLAGGLTLRDDREAAAGEAQAFATGLITYFLVAGLIEGFLLTRMFLTRAWNEDTQERAA